MIRECSKNDIGYDVRIQQLLGAAGLSTTC
uniref:Uncharacterized protein n=1 Tax=Anguilla anguilla TaxID=7936 RepID=A0A0E9SZL0_ANGAN